VPPALLLSLAVLTRPYHYADQEVSTPRSLSFTVLTFISLYAPQEVITPLLLALFRCPDLPPPLWLSGRECRSLTFSAVLTCHSLCAFQPVSVPLAHLFYQSLHVSTPALSRT